MVRAINAVLELDEPRSVVGIIDDHSHRGEPPATNTMDIETSMVTGFEAYGSALTRLRYTQI
jgi:hypothetical protein